MGLIYGLIDTALDALRIEGPADDQEQSYDSDIAGDYISNEQKVALFTMAMENSNYDYIYHRVFIILGLDSEYVAYKKGFRKRQERIYDNDPDYIIRRRK